MVVNDKWYDIVYSTDYKYYDKYSWIVYLALFKNKLVVVGALKVQNIVQFGQKYCKGIIRN